MPEATKQRPDPIYISKAFNLDAAEGDLDFFDANLLYDSQVFIDPFLIITSRVEEERKLFTRFNTYFEHAYKMAVQAKLNDKEIRKLRKFLSFNEPREIGLGYTHMSFDGSGLGPHFADAMLHFFLEHAASSVLVKKEVYPHERINPNIFAIVSNGVGLDGISDLTAGLVMDYLIDYTVKQCKEWGISLKKDMPVGQGFNFDTMTWTDGFYAPELPENPVKEGKPIIFIPKRWLRSQELADAKSTMVGMLRDDPDLSMKFHDLISKKLADIKLDEVVSAIMNDPNAESILKRYIEVVQGIGSEPYDFQNDVLLIMDVKKFDHYFDNMGKKEEPEDCATLLRYTLELVDEFETELARKDGWKDMWRDSRDGKMIPVKEEVIGRRLRGMGFSYFKWLPTVTFMAEAGTGSGFLDFSVIYKDCRIQIELKKLENSSSTGKSKVPAYLHGLTVQLPEYIINSKAKHGIYLTAQHYTGTKWITPKKGEKPPRDDTARVADVENHVADTLKGIKDELPSFGELHYRNIDISLRPSTSKR